ncbi:putative DNA mismatch repair protein (Mlh3) [Aspergillus fischeri NRRL 181]|uniref:DNA mismatch repair protein (Mlh3), putative n=1 Tax=Neosartorya fischeri (strain ATCC 1020 / DSM 3700 / CBS 544.65 / FGSC A1164 / JCM 1740 / NRRL 181 / WB 181) TaxID=331117 RepID=A1CXX4_NEOFI|nr:DNA mismatch repair protein (Mlh3), putative [Aspergillus fischeri NRRL 181]EAW25476.1 DNA mismatch repair protein (Mlh3), putative [Aspergillus fischeri NRRL 181]
MSSEDSRIEPLSPEVVAKIKSSTSITDLNRVVVELVKNALDANAHTVSVTVDFHRGGCVVEDDGDGIPPAEFESDGGLGKAHHTSKLNSARAVYGRRGLFLASLASLSLLTVISHHVRHNSTNSVIFHHSTPIARLIPAPSSHHLSSSSHGTRVTVNDLFGNMPVRVKSRALALQKPDEFERQWDDLRRLLVSLILASDHLTKLVVSTAGKERKLMIRSHAGRQEIRGDLDIKRITSILTQAGLIESPNSGSWNSVSASVPGISLRAAVSLVPSPTRKVQFISIGIDPVYPRNSTDLLYSEINRLFALSDFGAVEAAPVSSDGNPGPNFTSKAVNKWPMFYICIDVDDPTELYQEDHEVVPESNQSVQRLIDVLAAMISEFLKQHGLRPRAGRQTKGASRFASVESPGAGRSNFAKSVSSQDRSSIAEEALAGQLKLPTFQRPTSTNTTSDFATWSRVKCAREPPAGKHELADGWKKAHSRPASEYRDRESLSLCLETDDSSAGNNLEITENDGSDADASIPWTDPHTGHSHLINARTGQAINVRSQSTEFTVVERPRSAGTIQTLRALDRSRPRSAISSTSHNIWVENLLRRWENPAFSRPERPITAISDGESYGNTSDNGLIRPFDGSGESCGLDDFGLAKFRGRLSKSHLATANIIAQVDRKFILAKLADGHSSRSVLVLIDQHAADERCRIESLFGDMFADGHRQVQTIRIDPITFEIPLMEATLFGKHADSFASWGVGYAVERKSSARAALVVVHSLPALIAERCRLEPDLVSDLIRGEIWKHEENGRGALALSDQRTQRSKIHRDELGVETEDNWVERLKSCPQGIIDLLNSRACRTAIMFNDMLTAEECKSLIGRLARCVLPFQCAHGRPSMVPILDVREDEEFLGKNTECEYEYEREDGRRQPDLLEAFRSWQALGDN